MLVYVDIFLQFLEYSFSIQFIFANNSYKSLFLLYNTRHGKNSIFTTPHIEL